MSVRVAFLGGLGEIGRNCATIEIDGRLAMIDCGLMFPEEDMLGVDLVLPDFSSVLERRDDFACVILTHGHEDHIGALAYLLHEVNVPVYGTSLTVELARPRVEERGIDGDFRVIEPKAWVEHGPFRFSAIPVSHSVPDATGLVFDTPEGIVVHSGDFKMDPSPIDGVPTDVQAFARLGAKGVRLLLADSTNAERPGYTAPESSVGERMREIVREAEGRVIVACFASHIHRVQQAIDAVVANGRHYTLIGRSMLRNSEIAARLGLLDLHDDHRVEIDELGKLPPDQAAIISTGSQGEPFAGLSLLASGQHAAMTLDASDTVIISATPIPGNETRVSRVINNLVRAGVTVWHGRNSHVHVSGHAAREELMTFYNVVRPKALVPVHGEYQHLAANAALGRRVGIDEVHVLEDGDAVVLEGGALTVERGAVPAGYVYVDGSEVGGADDVLRDRRHLADDGVLIVTVGIDRQSGEVVFGPDVDSHGVTGSAEEGLLHEQVIESVVSGVAMLDHPLDLDSLRTRVRNRARKAVQEHAGRRPVVIPVVIEV